MRMKTGKNEKKLMSKFFILIQYLAFVSKALSTVPLSLAEEYRTNRTTYCRVHLF